MIIYKSHNEEDTTRVIYPEDVKKIREYLESHGDLDSRVKDWHLQDLYHDFSEYHCAGWLIPDEDWLEEFAKYINGREVFL